MVSCRLTEASDIAAAGAPEFFDEVASAIVISGVREKGSLGEFFGCCDFVAVAIFSCEAGSDIDFESVLTGAYLCVCYKFRPLTSCESTLQPVKLSIYAKIPEE